MSSRSPQIFAISILLAIGSLSLLPQLGSANESSLMPPVSSMNIAQNPTEREQQLERQREAERVLKEGERLKREVQNTGGDPNLQRRVNEEVTKVRESGGNSDRVQEADRELKRLRQQNNRSRYNYGQFNYPYYYNTTPGAIFTPGYDGNSGEYIVPVYGSPSDDRNRIRQTDRSREQRDDTPAPEIEVFGTAGFRTNNVSPGIGIRYNNIGLELAAIFNQDSLPGNLNDFSLPSNFLFNDLGVKKISPQWGGDFLGFVDVAPRVALYGSVGLYFQNSSRIAQSQATNELYKQTNETNVTGAVGGGVTYSASDSLSIGVGYHSIRGVTARVGVSF